MWRLREKAFSKPSTPKATRSWRESNKPGLTVQMSSTHHGGNGDSGPGFQAWLSMDSPCVLG